MKAVVWCIGFLFVAFLKSSAQALKKNSGDLHIEVNLPQFLYEGDRLEVQAKITNHSANECTGQVALQLFDATANTSVDGWFQNIFPVQYFTVAAGKTEAAPFPVEVPYLFKNVVRWRVVAQSGAATDTAEGLLPILTTKTLVTEQVVLPIQNGTQQVSFPKLLHADAATEQHALVAELFQNPIWHVVQALPHLAANTQADALSILSRCYAYAIALEIWRTMPNVQQAIREWKTVEAVATHADLFQDENAKAVVQENMPWLLAAKNEQQEKTDLALFFDSAQLEANRSYNFQQLKDVQNSNGSFSWFKGGPKDRFITQCIVAGIGHLKNLAASANTNKAIQHIAQPAISYLDVTLKTEHAALLKKKERTRNEQLRALQIQALYARSFFTDVALPQDCTTAYRFYQQQAQLQWREKSAALQAMTALALYRNNETKTTAVIVQTLKPVIKNSKPRSRPLRWWQNAITEATLLTEVFCEIEKEAQTITTLQTELIGKKHGTDWQTPIATANACYALLLNHTNPATEENIALHLGDTVFSTASGNELKTGFFKKRIPAPLIQPEMGNIRLQVQQAPSFSQKQISFPGVVYWQYFSDSNANAANAPVKIRKRMFVVSGYRKTETPAPDNNTFQVGDTLQIRLELTATEDLEYVQVKDGHAAALKPLPVATEYKMQKNNGYYQLKGAAEMQFLIPLLQKGTSVFEYRTVATKAGVFSNGNVTVQMAYVPEMIVLRSESPVRIE